MQWHDKRYDDEEYNGHQIRVYAKQISPGANWVVTVSVQMPDGKWLPDRELHDNSWPTLEMAFAAGKQVGREIADSGPK